MVENVEFLNRLRNGHLEKSAVTGVRRPSRSPKTAKTPLKVHLRLRFQNLGKPRTAGLCGRAARISDCGPLSCAKIERPSPLEKPSCKVRLFVQNRSRKYRPKVTVTTLLQIAFHRVFQLLSQTPHVCFHGRKCVHTRLCSKDRTQRLTRRNRGLPSLDHSAALCRQRNTLYSATLLYTYISRFSVTPHYQQQFYLRPSFITFFNFSHKWPTFAFTPESGYTLGFRRKIAHKRLHAETGGVSDGGGITTLGAFRTFTNIPGPGIRTASFAAFGAWSGVLPKNAESLRNSDALMRVAVPRRRGPAGLRNPFSFLSKLRLVCPALRAFPCVRGEGWYHYPQRALRAAETPDGRLPKGLICRFLRLPSSTPCAVTFSANTQISLSAISVANTFALWYDKS